MPKKSNSEGSVYYNKTRKRWTAQYYEKDINTGKRKRKAKDFLTEEEGKQFLENIMYQKRNSLYIKHNGIPLVELMKANLQLKYDTNLISDSQYVRVTETIKSIEKSSIAFEKIDEISSDDIQDFLNSKKSISNSSINKIFDQFKQAYNYAINQGYISKNPMVNVIKPKSDKETKKVRALTVKEQQQFTDWLIKQNVKNFPYKNIYLIQMYVGLRIGEVLALQTSDINLRLKKINVNKTLTKNLKGKVVMGKTTKTYSGLRNVPIPYSLYPYILEQIEIAKKNRDNPENLLFKPEEKQYTSLRDVNDVLKTVLKYTLGITDITTHSLRHTYGTRCIEAGMQPVVLQRLMGHKDISVTLNTYTDVLNEFKNEEIEKVNDYYLQKDLLSNPKTLNEFEK
jgi:lj928 prophage integrase